jgi:hypothetical protein
MMGWDGGKERQRSQRSRASSDQKNCHCEKSLQYEKTSMMLIASEISEGLIEKNRSGSNYLSNK